MCFCCLCCCFYTCKASYRPSSIPSDQAVLPSAPKSALAHPSWGWHCGLRIIGVGPLLGIFLSYRSLTSSKWAYYGQMSLPQPTYSVVFPQCLSPPRRLFGSQDLIVLQDTFDMGPYQFFHQALSLATRIIPYIQRHRGNSFGCKRQGYSQKAQQFPAWDIDPTKLAKHLSSKFSPETFQINV